MPSFAGCIVGPDLAVMSLVMVKKGAEEIPGTESNSYSSLYHSLKDSLIILVLSTYVYIIFYDCKRVRLSGLTDEQKPRRLGPKRASKIRKLFGLEKKECEQLSFKLDNPGKVGERNST